MSWTSFKNNNSEIKSRPFSIRERIASIRFAFDGVRQFVLREHNARIHLAATILVFAMAYRLGLSRNEIIVLVIITGAIWAAEIFNTAIEKVMDHVSPQYHPEVKYIKDLSAAAVLMTAIVAAIVGIFIFIPKFF